MSDTDLAIIGDRTGDAERLEAFAQRRGDFERFDLTLLDRDGCLNFFAGPTNPNFPALPA